MKSGGQDSNFSRIAFVGADLNSLLGGSSSFILKSLAKHFSSGSEKSSAPEVVYFSNYLYEAESLTARDGLRCFHLHSLPSKVEEFDLLVYFIDNSSESYLLNWYRESYPGIVILFDASLFKLELFPFLHATDPIGIDKKLESLYPEAKISIGKQHVLGHSIEIYAGVYNFLNSLKSDVPILVLEERIAEILKAQGVETSCIDISNCLLRSEFKRTTKGDKLSRSLFILNSPFSLSSKEIRVLYGAKSYRDLNYPEYFILESNQGRIQSIERIQNLTSNKHLLETIDGIVVTDLTSYQGTPSIVYEGLLSGIKISLPELLKPEFQGIENFHFHSRLTSYTDIIREMEDMPFAYGYGLGSEFSKRIFESILKFKPKIEIQSRNRKEDIQNTLFLKLNGLSSKYCNIQQELEIEEDSLCGNSMHLNELFDYGRD